MRDGDPAGVGGGRGAGRAPAVHPYRGRAARARRLVARAGVVVLLLLLVAGAAGCWDRVEPDRLAAVVAVGLDRGEQLPLRVTAQVSVPRLLGGGPEAGGGAGAQPPFVNQVVEARGVSEAVRILQEHSPRVLHFGHLQVVVVSEELARSGLAPVLDYLTSERESRRVVQLAVSSVPPREVLEVRTRLEHLPGISVVEELRHLPTTVGIPDCTIIRFLNALHDEGMEPYLPVLHRVDASGRILEKPPGAPEEPVAGAGAPQPEGGGAGGRGGGGGRSAGSGGEQGAETVRASGVAVFRGDRMVGTLNELEARGLAWLMGRLEQGMAVVPAELAGGGPAFLHVRRVETGFEPRLEGGRPVMRVELKVMADVMEWLAPSYELTPAEADRLEAVASRTIADQVADTLARLKEFRSDVCGFGWSFYRRYPRAWRQYLGARWDELFADLPVELEVKVHIASGLFAWRGPTRH